MVTAASILVLLIVAAYLIGRPLRASGALSDIVRFSDLWRWHGTVDRRTYALVGVAGVAIKHNIDRSIGAYFFGRGFSPLNYWVPPVQAIRTISLPSADATFLATMLAIALPFIWVGLAMTIRRLRSAGLPLWLVVLFFIPVANLGFFVLLSLIPPRPSKSGNTDGARDSAVGSFIPRDQLGSSAMACAS